MDEAINNTQEVSKLASKLETLVVDILELARADSASEIIDPIDLTSLIEEIQSKYQLTINEKNICFTFNQNLKEWPVTQKIRLTQILENLISNSIKYCDLNKDEQTISVNATEDINHIYISVKDNGPGIPIHLQKDAFNLFKRFHPNLADGSGIGLSIVKKHIERIDANIELISSPAGSEFTISLNKQRNL